MLGLRVSAVPRALGAGGGLSASQQQGWHHQNQRAELAVEVFGFCRSVGCNFCVGERKDPSKTVMGENYGTEPWHRSSVSLKLMAP